jgi:hypothetical protein
MVSWALHDMKRVITLLLIFCPLLSVAEDDFLRTMVQGKYLLVGKAVDSENTYHGKVEIKDVNGSLVVAREIAGKNTEGSAAIEAALNGEARVLRIRFTENEAAYEQTCMVGGDLDNYARISCYLYKPNVKTMQPGLEVLFNDHSAQ